MTMRAKFANDPRSPAAARRFVAKMLAHCPPSVQEPAILLVSELATNAVQHAREAALASRYERVPGSFASRFAMMVAASRSLWPRLQRR